MATHYLCSCSLNGLDSRGFRNYEMLYLFLAFIDGLFDTLIRNCHFSVINALNRANEGGSGILNQAKMDRVLLKARMSLRSETNV